MSSETKTKPAPTAINGTISKSFRFKTVTLNFNNANFQRDAGYDDKDFLRRVLVLKRMIVRWVKHDGVALINIQEISGRFMRVETLRAYLLEELSDSWTATGSIPRQGDVKRCLSLMTLWNADVLHFDAMKNFHFSEWHSGQAGDRLASKEGIQDTSNALIMEFSLTVPVASDTDVGDKVPVHRGGTSIDVLRTFVNVNVRLPMRGPLKVMCLEKLRDELEKYSDGPIHIAGDMNMFADEQESMTMRKQLHALGHVTCCENPTEILSSKMKHSYASYDGQRRRNTTFIGMKYDLKHMMKLVDADCERDKFAVWCGGNVEKIQKTFDRPVLPLDWVILFSPAGWSANSVVVDLDDIRQAEGEVFTEWEAGFPKDQAPDYGNYLSDHLPVMTQLEFIAPENSD